MRRPGSGLRTWSLMVAVAIVAVSLTSARVESAPSAAVAVVGAGVCLLAYERCSRTVALTASLERVS